MPGQRKKTIREFELAQLMKVVSNKKEILPLKLLPSMDQFFKASQSYFIEGDSGKTHAQTVELQDLLNLMKGLQRYDYPLIPEFASLVSERISRAKPEAI